jgi:FkbM family methyltransferase
MGATDNSIPAAATAVADGDYGPIEGALDDRVVFGRYRAQRTWSPDVVGLLARWLTPGGTLIDVGAHIGLISIGVARACDAQCLAFEPAPENYRLLCRNVARQGLERRIEALDYALDAESGQTELALSGDNSGDHRLLRHTRAASGRSVRVAGARLDDVLAQRALASPVAMKLDTQGGEARVLAGARTSIARVEHLVLEYWPAGLHRMGDRVESLSSLLCEHFPWAALLLPGQVLRAQPARTLLEALARFVPDDGSDQGFFDLVLCRSERAITG